MRSAGSGSTITGSTTGEVPELVAVRLNGAESPGPSRLSGPLSKLSRGEPWITSKLADTGGIGKVVPGVCSADSPAPVMVSSTVFGMGIPEEAKVSRTVALKQTLALGHAWLLGTLLLGRMS